MLLFYRMLGLVSSPSNDRHQLSIANPVTRTALMEALLTYIALNKHEAQELADKAKQSGSVRYEETSCFNLSKLDFFKYFLTLDPKASLVSFDTAWDYCLETLNNYAAIYRTNNPEGGFYFDLQGSHTLVRNAKYVVNRGLTLEADKGDEALAHLFVQHAPPEEMSRAITKTSILREMVDRDNAILKRLEGINDAISALTQTQTRRDILGNQIVSIDPQQLQQLIGMAALPATAKETGRLTMAERITKAAVETGTGVVSAMQEGFKISVSQQGAKKIVQLFHDKLGHHIPGASTPLGQKAEEIMIPAFVHFAASALSDKVPKAEFVQRACLRAITGTSKDSGDELLQMLLPLFSEIVSMETMNEVAQQFTGELVIQGSRPVQLEGVESKALSAGLIQQLNEIPEDEDFEIVIRRPKAKAEGKMLVSPSTEPVVEGVE